ncbi:MAG: hypothetical protein FJ296_03685, partial [Planctomycetes bacterium]|nr:hypothetical protein [Planctomycetota bacterium]
MRLSTLQRSAFAGVCTLALLATVSASGPVPDSELQFAPPEFGVIQFTSDEAFIDLPVPLAEAWKTTLEVTASLISQVRGDLPYLENNGRIVAGDLWVAVEAQGAPGATWTRIRVAITPDASGYGQVRAEVLLDAIADRLEPPAPAREPARFSYPPPVPAAENVPVESVTNNYYYGSGPYDGLPSNVYVPTYAAPAYYPVYYSYPAYSSFGCSPWAWNSGWWFGWGGPWCNPWGSSFSLWYGNNWSWSWSACYGSVYASGGWNGWWGPWDCGPSISIGWWGWDDCDDWNDGGNWDDDVSGGKGDDIIIIGDDNVIITGDGDDDGLVALDARQTGLRSLPQGDITLPGTAAGGDAGTDRTPRVTDRASRRASEPLAPVVVTRTERGPRPRTPVAEPRTSSERTGGQPEIARPSVVVVGSTRDSDEGREGSGPVPTSTSPSRSSKKAGPTVVKLGSAPYSARVAPAPPPSRSAGTVATTQGGAPVFTPSAPSVSQGQDQGRTGGTTTTASHPYSNPYTSAPSSGGSSPSGKASSGGSTSVGRSSAPAPRAPST